MSDARDRKGTIETRDTIHGRFRTAEGSRHGTIHSKSTQGGEREERRIISLVPCLDELPIK